MSESTSTKDAPVTRTRAALTRLMRAPACGRPDRAAELAVTPLARIQFARLDEAYAQLNHRVVVEQAAQLEQLRLAVADIEASLPAVLNAITSMSGAARLVKRELDTFRSEIESSLAGSDATQQQHATEIAALREQVAEGDLRVLGEVRPHVETLAWLMQRVEIVRFEMLNELRYGRSGRPHIAWSRGWLTEMRWRRRLFG